MTFFTIYHQTSKQPFHSLFEQHKVVHVLAPNEDLDSYYRNLAKDCGIPLVYEEDPVSGEINMNKWTEIKYEPEKASDSYKSSNKSQPLHTDYGYFSFEIYAAFFYCVTQAKFGGATTFIDADIIVEILKNEAPALFEHLQKTKIHFGRKNNPLAHNDDFVFSKDALGWKINWNYYRALGDEQNKALVEDFKDFLDTYIEKSCELKELRLQEGEGVFFQDRRVLHGRNSFVGDRQLNKGGIAKEVPPIITQLLSLQL